MSKLDAWLAYAEAGIYTLPVIRERKPDGSIGFKNPGSAVGKNWPAFSSIDPAQVKAWDKKYPDAAIAGDMARSGLIAFDVDFPDNVPPVLAKHLRKMPAQSTRVDDPSHGHYLARLPRGQVFGNSTGSLGKNWGEVRCAHGAIILSPSTHEKVDQGGLYEWRRTGPIPLLPAELASKLNEATGSEVPLSNADLKRFRAEHDEDNGGARLDGPMNWFGELISDPHVARHDALVNVMCWAFEEASVGCYSADEAYESIEEVFRDSLAAPPVGVNGSKRSSRPFYRSEFDGAAAWAAAQVIGKDPAEIWDKINRRKSERGRSAAVERAKLNIWANEQARRELAEENWSAPPVFGSLADQFANPLPENGFIVKQVAGTGMTILFIAQWKAGKTTAGFNLAVDLADGTPFLGRFDTALTDDTTVAYWNFELDGRRAQDWFRELDPQHPDRLHVEHWRGHSLPIETPSGEDFAVRYLTERTVSVLIVDPIGSAYEGDENSNTELKFWFKAMERIKRRAGLELLIIVAHAGHGGSGEDGEGLPRIRGGSKAMGDADAFWFYQHSGEHGQPPPDTRRYFKAYGRDIDTDQITLDYDAASRRLFVVEGGGSRTNDRAQQMARRAYDVVAAHFATHNEPFSGKEGLEKAMGTGKTDAKRAGIARAAEIGWIEITNQGTGRAMLYELGSVAPSDGTGTRIKGSA